MAKPSPFPSLLERLERGRRDRRAVVALEFALLAVPAICLLLGVMEVALSLYLQEVLDYATVQSVRKVQIGSLPAGSNADAFKNTVLCPILSSFLPCQNVTVEMMAVADFFNGGQPLAPPQNQSTFCTGTPGQLMYAKIYYPAPVFAKIPFGITSPSTPGASFIVSYAAFENENPTGAAVAAGGC
jgi:Flp pilus assembly protein TadG